VVSFFQSVESVLAAAFQGFVSAMAPLVNFIKTVFLVYLKLLEIEFKIMLIPIKIAVGLIILNFRLMKAIVTPILRSLIDAIRATFNPIKAIIGTAVKALSAVLGPPFRAARDLIKGVLHDIRLAVSFTFQNLHKAFSVGFDAIKTIVSTGWDFVQTAGEGVASAIKAVLNGIIGAVNGAIGGLNAVIRTANRLPGPDISTISKLPQLASGAIIRRRSGGTDVTVGEGNSDEAVLPLNRRSLRAAGLGGITVAAGAVVIDARGAHPAMGAMIQGQIDEAFDRLYQRLRTA
jgi:phage-related protein